MMVWREHLWTFVLSLIFTLLIWLWAESENRETRILTTRLSVSALGSDSDLRIRFIINGAPASGHLDASLTVQGSRNAIQRAESRLRDLDVPVTNLSDGQEPVISLASQLSQLTVFDELGLTLISVDPVQVTLRADEFVTRAVPVKPRFEGIQVDEMTIEPPAVDVLMSRANWALMGQIYGDNLLIVDLPPDAMRGLVPGELRTLTGQLRLPRELTDHATIDEPNETVRITLRPRLVIDEIELSVPVKLQLLPLEQALYDVIVPDASQRITRVKFTGNADLIRQLRERALRVFAIVDLSPDELERGIASKDIEIQPLPAGLTVSFPDLAPGQRPSVPFTIMRRTSSVPQE